MDSISKKAQLILDLHTVNAIKFGSFKLKSGILSPYYLDLRVLVSYPYLMELTAEVFWEELRVLDFDLVVGVPYTAIPIATAVSLKHNQTMIFVRKERKDYGTKKLIEGVFHAGQKAVLIDDVITNGDSKIETVTSLKEEGLIVEDIVILLDRGQGGCKYLEKQGYHCHPILKIHDILDVLSEYKRVSPAVIKESKAFLKKHNETR